MTVRKTLSIVVLLSIAALAACSDISGPDAGWCPITGGPGTCPGVAAGN
jgi:hypothetical protein